MSKKDEISSLLQRRSQVNPEGSAAKELFTVPNPIQEHNNTEIQIPANDEIQVKRKKATFDLDPKLHAELKITAVKQDKSMVEIVEEAIRRYIDSL